MNSVFAGISIFSLIAFCWQYILRKKAVKALVTAQEQIQLREKKIQTILDNAPIVFSAIDANGIFHISEGKGLEKLGRKNNQSVGQSIFEMHNQNPVILDAVRKALNGEQVATSFSLNGISYDLFIGPEKNAAGIVTGVSMLSVDVSDRKRIEEEKAQLLIREKSALETSKLKSEFMATMSHEIRTPINGVLGMTNLLLDTNLTSEQKEFANAIKQSGSGLLTLINDILDFSKIEAGKMEFEEIHFEMPKLIQHIANNFNYAAKEKGIAIKTQLNPTLQDWVQGDPGRFRQILNNLIGNAVKFTEKGQITIRAEPDATLTKGPHCRIRFEVEDTGIGILKESLEKMFIAFTQAEASMSRRFGGTGLGLSICKQLVEKMGGQIGVTSVAGKGSTFWFVMDFKLGLAPVVEEPRAPQLPEPKSTQPLNKAARILIAEDNKTNQIITSRMLEKMGYQTVIVSDGIEALEALKQTAFDLVLMDCQMPEMDGLEATRQIRLSSSLQIRQIPVLAMTANAMKGDKDNCLEAGMDDYISKPVSYEALGSMVQKWLEPQDERLKQKKIG